MGKFDGILICSDIDGTFRSEDSVAANSEAVRYFTENGGHFTFCTGRTVDYLRQPEYCSIINAPACLFNGSVVYDYREDKLLQEQWLPFSVQEFYDCVQPHLALLDRIYFYSGCVDAGIVLDDLTQIPDSVREMHPLKIICTAATEEKANAFRDLCLQQPLAERSYISKSWWAGVEFNPATGTKGHALDFIRTYLGNIHTTIGVGDYENDIPLLRHADIGVAVANALPEVKAAAKLTVCDAKDCALRELIELLDQKVSALQPLV